MATTRESFFQCSFRSAHDHRTAHVRAWTASEAELRFREALAEDGVDEPGTIEVAGAGERQVTRRRGSLARAH